LWNQLNTLQQDLAQEAGTNQMFQQLAVGTSVVSLTGLTVGYVIWLIRGGSLLASTISALPAWFSFDPLPVLEDFEETPGARRRRRADCDDFTFESLLETAGERQAPEMAAATVS
jgi:hypothetical protein